MNKEAAVISAVCEHKDMSILMEPNVEQLFRSHKDVYDDIKNYYYKYRSLPDIEVLTQKFRDFEPVPVKAETDYYLEQLRNSYLTERITDALTRSAHALKNDAPSEVLSKIQTELMQLQKFTTTVRDLDVTDWETAMKRYEQVAERAEVMGGAVGIKTGIDAIDINYATGMAGGHLIPIIGWPEKGKTWFATYLAIKAWEQGYKPMIVSLEMSPEDMSNRVYGLMGSGLFRISDLQRGSINMDTFENWSRRRFLDKNKFILVSSDGQDDVTPMHVQAKIDQHRPDLVICDYHQLFSDNKKSPGATEQAKNVSREFKLMAVSNNIPIIDIVAATKDDVSDLKSPPMLSHVAWSKQIHYDADAAMAVHRHTNPETGDPLDVIEVVSRKNRHGTEFAFMLKIDLARGIIEEGYTPD